MTDGITVFSKAIVENPLLSLTYLNLAENTINVPEFYKAIATLTSLEELHLSQTDIAITRDRGDTDKQGVKGLAGLTAVVQHMKKLTALHLYGNHIGKCTDDLTKFADAIAQSNVTILNLSTNNIDDGGLEALSPLFEPLGRELTLDLSSNYRIGNENRKRLSERKNIDVSEWRG